jgi:thiamine pyrophosphate-dependent acetolactate synthase large subunit-like protein
MPMILITRQKGILSSKQGRFQIVDVVSSITPLTKMTRQIVSTTTIPSIIREAFGVAEQERPGPVHPELPEDIAGEEAPELLPVDYSENKRVLVDELRNRVPGARDARLGSMNSCCRSYRLTIGCRSPKS